MIEAITRPDDKGGYQFFRNTESGSRFKVKMTTGQSGPLKLDPNNEKSPVVNPAQFAVCLTISMIDDADKAMQQDGLPIIDSHTHVFTSVETSDPDQTMTERLLSILTNRIAAMEVNYAGRLEAQALQKSWSDGALIQINLGEKQ